MCNSEYVGYLRCVITLKQYPVAYEIMWLAVANNISLSVLS